MKLVRTNSVEGIDDCMPIINYAFGEGRQNVYNLEMELMKWHSHYNVFNIKDEVQKMKELIGEPTFEGKEIEDLEVEFFIKQHIWTYTLEENEESFIAIYLNEEGLSVEINDELEDDIEELLKILIEMLIR